MSDFSLMIEARRTRSGPGIKAKEAIVVGRQPAATGQSRMRCAGVSRAPVLHMGHLDSGAKRMVIPSHDKHGKGWLWRRSCSRSRNVFMGSAIMKCER